MSREKEIIEAGIEYTMRTKPNVLVGDRFSEEMKIFNRNKHFEEGAKWADKTMAERVCRCFCDDLCEISRSGMCYHKYDHQQQVRNDFQYNECNQLQLLILAMEK